MSGAAPFDCPRCGVPLAMSERQGVEIDHCPRCRGVWLDRGELDKIIERAPPEAALPEAAPPGPGAPSAWTRPPAAPPPACPAPSRHPPQGHGRHGKGGHDGRRKSWLREIFD